MTLPSGPRHMRFARGGTLIDWLGLLVLLALCFV
jgi:hypothetical protein